MYITALLVITVLMTPIAYHQVSAQGGGDGGVQVVGGDEDTLREMLRAVVQQRFPFLEDSTITMYVGSLPEDTAALGFEPTLPENSVVIGTVTSEFSPEGKILQPNQLIFTTDMSPQEVIDFFAKTLPSDEFRDEMNFQPGGGFVTDNAYQIGNYCFNDDQSHLTIIAASAGNQSSLVTLEVIKEFLPEQGLCGNIGRPPFDDAFRVMPRLTAPEGISLRANGGGGGAGTAKSEAILTGEPLNIEDLLAFYDDELNAAGWEILESASADTGGWLSAQFVDEDDTTWLATLTLLQHPTRVNEYSAALTVFPE
jgi:hypothetical protein